MIRYALTAVFAVLLCTVTILAKDIAGTIKSVDNDKNTITVTIKDGDATKDVTFKLAKDVKVTQKNAKDMTETDVENGLKNDALKTRIDGGKARATLTTDNDDDAKASVTKVVVNAGKGGGAPGMAKKGGKKGKGKDM
jgi:hypothetical protein